MVENSRVVGRHRGRIKRRGAVVQKKAQRNPVPARGAPREEAVRDGIKPVGGHRVGSDGKLVVRGRSGETGSTSIGGESKRTIVRVRGSGVAGSRPERARILHERVSRWITDSHILVPEILPVGRLRVGIEVRAIASHDGGIADQSSVEEEAAGGDRSRPGVGVGTIESEGFPGCINYQVNIVPDGAIEGGSGGHRESGISGRAVLNPFAGAVGGRGKAGDGVIEAIEVQNRIAASSEADLSPRGQSVRAKETGSPRDA